MPDSKLKRGHPDRRDIANREPYEIGYFAQKHDISREQTKELFRKIGNDRDKLNAAASRLFKK